jgi:hypothetical protein
MLSLEFSITDDSNVEFSESELSYDSDSSELIDDSESELADDSKSELADDSESDDSDISSFDLDVLMQESSYLELELESISFKAVGFGILASLILFMVLEHKS